MARSHGRKAVYTIDGNDLSAFTTDVGWNQTGDTHEATGFGVDDKEYEPGLRDGTTTLAGNYDTTATGPRAILQPLIAAAAVPFIRQVEGAGTTLPQDSVSVIVNGYVETTPVGDIAKWSAELQHTGAVDSTPQP